jgi:hypothetical protein
MERWFGLKAGFSDEPVLSMPIRPGMNADVGEIYVDKTLEGM